jgi:anthranilate phosphoribosyltransferase
VSSPLTEAIGRLASGRDLSSDEAAAAVGEIMAGEATEATIAAFLTALRLKGETADELAGAVRVARERSSGWEPEGLPAPVLDTCGTGGDGAGTVNVSTATAIVVASCGVAVAKHGNRSATGVSGSAEVLAELGVAVEPDLPVLRRSLIELGITFLFAPKFHPALRFAGPVRRQLPFRTLFNLVGPLANPARPDYQLVGVAGERQADLIAGAMAQLGTPRAAVVTGSDGLDEVTLAGPTRVLWVESGRITPEVWHPDDFGLPRVVASDLRVTGPAQSAALIRAMLAGEPGPVRAMVLANAAAALRVARRVATLKDGVAQAAAAIDSGAACDLLGRWCRIGQGG